MAVDPLSLVYLPVAIGLGALHALEPGHSKTLVAAYMINIKGTKRDAFFLGVSAATTHSIIVIALSVAALWLGREAFTEKAEHWLQIGSGIVVTILGLILLIRQWMRLKPKAPASHEHHHHAPNPVIISTPIATGTVEIIDTPAGERMRFTADGDGNSLTGVTVRIRRDGSDEILELTRQDATNPIYLSNVAPAEPHEFKANVTLRSSTGEESRPFAMFEPEGHGHSHDAHDDLDEDAHARAHAAAMPTYAEGQRPTMAQVIAFGAAGGMIPCSASITVMLLALSTGKFLLGVLAVLCFSVGLAATLVGMGMVVSVGADRLMKSQRFAGASRLAPLISSGVIMLSGAVAIALAH